MRRQRPSSFDAFPNFGQTYTPLQRPRTRRRTSSPPARPPPLLLEDGPVEDITPAVVPYSPPATPPPDWDDVTPPPTPPRAQFNFSGHPYDQPMAQEGQPDPVARVVRPLDPRRSY